MGSECHLAWNHGPLKPNFASLNVQEFSAFFKAWRFVKTFFSEFGPVSVDWRKTSRQPTGGEQNTHSNYRCAQCVTTHTDISSLSPTSPIFPTISPRHTNRLTTFHHANTRGSRAGRLRIAHLGVLHVSCLIPCRTWHCPQALVLSHLPHLSFQWSLHNAHDL